MYHIPHTTCGRSGRQLEKAFLGCISEILRCKMLTVGKDIGWGCSCATSLCDLDLTFNLGVVTLLPLV